MPSQYGVGIRHLAEAALAMVRQALDAFARMDGERALAVIRADNDVDVEFKSIIRQLITHMMEDPRTITTSIEIISIARAIERIGDHAKNISEQVIFVVEEAPEGGFTARALGVSIVTEADTLAELHAQVRDAVQCHFDDGRAPKVIRLHFVRDEVISA